MNTLRIAAFVFFTLGFLFTLHVRDVFDERAIWESFRFHEHAELNKAIAHIAFLISVPLICYLYDRISETKFPVWVLFFIFPVCLGGITLYQIYGSAAIEEANLTDTVTNTFHILLFFTFISVAGGLSLLFEFSKISVLPVAASVLITSLFLFEAFDYYFLTRLIEFTGYEVAMIIAGAVMLGSSLLLLAASYRPLVDRQKIYIWNLARKRKEKGKYPLIFAGGIIAGISFCASVYFVPFLFEFHTESLFGFVIYNPSGLILTGIAVTAPLAAQYIQVMGSQRGLLITMLLIASGTIFLAFGQTGTLLFLCALFYILAASLSFTASVPFSLFYSGTNRNFFGVSVFVAATVLPVMIYLYTAPFFEVSS